MADLIGRLHDLVNQADIVRGHSPVNVIVVPSDTLIHMRQGLVDAVAALRAKDEEIARLGECAIVDQHRIEAAEQRADRLLRLVQLTRPYLEGRDPALLALIDAETQP